MAVRPLAGLSRFGLVLFAGLAFSLLLDHAVVAQQPPRAQNQAPDPAPDEAAGAPQNPFLHRIPIPDFPRDIPWLNVAGPLRKQDLRGKFVLLDFWTYCCINCLHILPELKKLERAYPNELVVIGVHSAKFETERDSQNIAEAILRYEIEHPVVNDANHRVWNTFGVNSWPTVLLIDPEGNAVWGRNGEIEFKDVDRILQLALPYYRQRQLLDQTPLRFDLLAHRQQPTPLRFPGKVLADEAGRRLFISDSNHNRIVVATLDGQLLETIGSGAIGRADGGLAEASFDHPQGMALAGDTLYVADTENHLLRKVDLQAKQVRTIAGTGVQLRGSWPGMEQLEAGGALPERYVGPPPQTALNSPWDVWIHGEDLYIAMAGPHQIWKMPLDESEIGPYAGNGREDIVDGPLLPRVPYELGYSSFAQPSGLTADGQWLFVADSEGSSIRAVPFDPTQSVRTVVGTSKLPGGRLFLFGDRDGAGLLQLNVAANEYAGELEQTTGPALQHCLGLTYHQGQLYVADTYNNKIRVVDVQTSETRTLAGTGQPGSADMPAQFDEPAGIAYAHGTLYVADTNSHRIRTIDLATGQVGTFVVSGLAPPQPPTAPTARPDFSRAAQVMLEPAKVKATAGTITLQVALNLPTGWKINPLAPAGYWLEAAGDAGPIARNALGRRKLDRPAAEFAVKLPIRGPGTETVKLAMDYFYCQEGAEGLCKVGSVVWTVPLVIDESAPTESVLLPYDVPN